MGNGKVVLYITFIDFDNAPKSGSSVRPMRMYDAFIERGYDVKLLSGAGNNRQVRNENVKEIKNWLKSNSPEFCYIEPPSGPLFFYCDRSLIRIIHKMQIPIGFFYRDLYWKFPAGEFENNEHIGKQWIKHKIIKLMQYRDLILIKSNVDKVYFPSAACNDFMKLDKYSVLPPGCTEIGVIEKKKVTSTAIYVGSATVRYGLELILESSIEVAKKIPFNLIIVCPKNQWEQWIIDYPKYKELPYWIEIFHLSDGPELDKLYKKSDFALVPLLKTKYNNLALPIKLFEYISRLLPVVVTKCSAMTDFLNQYDIGYLSEDNALEYSNAISQMIEDTNSYQNFKINLVQVRQKNLWVKRVDQISLDLQTKN